MSLLKYPKSVFLKLRHAALERIEVISGALQDGDVVFMSQ